MGRQGPAPLGGRGRGEAPEGLYLLTDQPALEQAAHSSKGPRAVDTFVREAAAERQETIIRAESLGRGP